MIQIINNPELYLDFICGFRQDERFSDPYLLSDAQIERRVLRAPKKPDHLVLGVFDGAALTGLFVFLILAEEQYMEMIAGLSRDENAYEELTVYLRAHYRTFQADFVFNPNNALLKGILLREGASFLSEQQKMLLRHLPAPMDGSGIIPLSDTFFEQYRAIHNQDLYWTAEKVAAAPERFRALLALCGKEVVGYIDVTINEEENEPFDLFVKPEFRRRGYGRKLLARAIELNCPRGMMLTVDTDNLPAIRLYESLGFEKEPGQNTLTAQWQIALS